MLWLVIIYWVFIDVLSITFTNSVVIIRTDSSDPIELDPAYSGFETLSTELNPAILTAGGRSQPGCHYLKQRLFVRLPRFNPANPTTTNSFIGIEIF